ncbi:unnamed protein product, partial [Allacma fusca]
YSDGYTFLGIGFTPADVSTDDTLDDKLCDPSPAPDARFASDWSEVPQEHFLKL